jgi:hypothetical protein
MTTVYARSAASSCATTAVVGKFAAFFVSVTLTARLHRHAFGFGSITYGLVFAVSVLDSLVAQLAFGGLSDQIIRRGIVLPAIGTAMAGFGGADPQHG